MPRLANILEALKLRVSCLHMEMRPRGSYSSRATSKGNALVFTQAGLWPKTIHGVSQHHSTVTQLSYNLLNFRRQISRSAQDTVLLNKSNVPKSTKSNTKSQANASAESAPTLVKMTSFFTPRERYLVHRSCGGTGTLAVTDRAEDSRRRGVRVVPPQSFRPERELRRVQRVRLWCGDARPEFFRHAHAVRALPPLLDRATGTGETSEPRESSLRTSAKLSTRGAVPRSPHRVLPAPHPLAIQLP